MALRVVAVGLGSIGRRHARLLSRRPDVALEVVEPNAAALELARQHIGPLRPHRSFESMLKTKPDLVLIATPPWLHADQTVAALEAGAHVFCEKPMSDNLADARRMKAAADETGKILNVGFHLHFCEGLRAMKAAIDDGELGQVLHAHMHVGSHITLVNSASRCQAQCEGSLMLDYSHQPDLLWWLFRKAPRAVIAVGLQDGNLPLSSRPNVAAIICEYDAPFVATIHLNYVQMPERHTYEIIGDEGWATLDFNQGLLSVGRRREQDVRTFTYGTEKDDMVRTEAAIESWRTGRRAPVRI